MRSLAYRSPPAWFWLAAIVAVGLGLRLAWVLHVQPVPFGDTYWYENVARNLVDGHGFAANHHGPFEPPDPAQPTAYYPPAYPFALAAVWKVFGFSLRSGEVLNAVLGAATIPFIYGLAHKIFDRRAGLFAAGLFAAFPNAIAWLPLLLAETLFTLLFVAALWLLVSSKSQTRLRGAAAVLAFGLIVGLSLLTRGEGLVLMPTALIFWLARDGWRAGLQQVAPALVGVALIVAPWTIRNLLVLDSPIAVASNTGVNLRIGHSPQATGTWALLDDPIDGVPGWDSLDHTDAEARASRVYPRRAVRYALTHPRREFVLAKEKVRYLYQADDDIALALDALGKPITPQWVDTAIRPVTRWSWYGLLMAAVVTFPFWLGLAPQRRLLPLVVTIWTAFHVVFFGMPRFHLPLLPLVIIAAAAGAVAAYDTLRRRTAEVRARRMLAIAR